MLEQIVVFLHIDMSATIGKIENDLTKIYASYESKFSNASSSSSNAQASSSSSSRGSILRNLMSFSSSNGSSSRNTSSSTISELYIYLNTTYITAESSDFDDLDILQWWKIILLHFQYYLLWLGIC